MTCEFPKDFIRYQKSIEILENIDLGLNKNSRVLDLGSPIPYITYYLAAKYGCTVECKDINLKFPYSIENVRGSYFNLNLLNSRLGLQEWDFISFTEVLEHLVCNLNLVKEKVISSLKDGQYMLISYPLGNRKIAPYGQDLLDQNWETTHGHLREFPNHNALDFITNLKITAKEKVIPPSNPDGSIIIVYKKEFV